MEQNRGLTDLIYEYYESRILFGIYRYGERLSVRAEHGSVRIG